jgi:hypothetical protein
MTPSRLIANGCSYMYSYSQGGLSDLSQQLGINSTENLAVTGSCNSRIIRTTLRDSYQTSGPTLYIIGITYLSRHELPLLYGRPETDGKWQSINNNFVERDDCDLHFTYKDIKDYCALWDKFSVLGIEDLAVNLQYQLLSLCDSLQYQGHRCVIFNTAESVLDWIIDKPAFDLLKSKKQLVQGLRWKSIPWQFEQGATWPKEDEHLPAGARHVAPGQHQWLNEFLVDYINQHGILE